MSDAPGMYSSRQKKPESAVGIIVVLSVAAVLLIGGIVGWWLLFRSETNVPPGGQVEVVLRPGESTAQIGRQLVYAGVVQNSLMFRLQEHFLGSGDLKPGDYSLPTAMSCSAVLKKPRSGPDIVYYDIPIPEGFTARQVAARFSARAGIPADELMSLVTSGAAEFEGKHPYLKNAYGGSLEGYLFPKTYRVKQGTSAKDVVEMMLDQFDLETAALDVTYAKSQGYDLAGVVTVASIIQREVKLSREYPTVASVIYNRLAVKMRLQLDSTVFYVTPEGITKLTNTELFNMSPYNTYRHAGLPPGPICNPGLPALQAAAKPARTKYLYYVLTSRDGSQTFATTYKDFLAAKKKFQQLFGQ
jgi:UPF0755 protein